MLEPESLPMMDNAEPRMNGFHSLENQEIEEHFKLENALEVREKQSGLF